MIKKTQQGITLLEVLIAIVILGVAALGTASLHIQGLSVNRNSLMRTQAAMLANDIIERMYVNIDKAKAGSYNGSFVANASELTAPATDCDDSATSCDTDQLAAYDLYNWRSRVKENLPNATVSITTDASVTPVKTTITAQWDWDAGKSAEEQASEQFVVYL